MILWHLSILRAILLNSVQAFQSICELLFLRFALLRTFGIRLWSLTGVLLIKALGIEARAWTLQSLIQCNSWPSISIHPITFRCFNDWFLLLFNWVGWLVLSIWRVEQIVAVRALDKRSIVTTRWAALFLIERVVVTLRTGCRRVAILAKTFLCCQDLTWVVHAFRLESDYELWTDSLLALDIDGATLCHDDLLADTESEPDSKLVILLITFQLTEVFEEFLLVLLRDATSCVLKCHRVQDIPLNLLITFTQLPLPILIQERLNIFIWRWWCNRLRRPTLISAWCWAWLLVQLSFKMVLKHSLNT